MTPVCQMLLVGAVMGVLNMPLATVQRSPASGCGAAGAEVDLFMFVPEAPRGGGADGRRVVRQLAERLGERTRMRFKPAYFVRPGPLRQRMTDSAVWVGILDGTNPAAIGCGDTAVRHAVTTAAGGTDGARVLVAALPSSGGASLPRVVAVSRAYEAPGAGLGDIRAFVAADSRHLVVNTAEDALLALLLGIADAALVNDKVLAAVGRRRPAVGEMHRLAGAPGRPLGVLCSGSGRQAMVAAACVAELLSRSPAAGPVERLNRYLLAGGWRRAGGGVDAPRGAGDVAPSRLAFARNVGSRCVQWGIRRLEALWKPPPRANAASARGRSAEEDRQATAAPGAAAVAGVARDETRRAESCRVARPRIEPCSAKAGRDPGRGLARPPAVVPVHFGYASGKAWDAGDGSLARVRAFLGRAQDYEVELIGHTDRRGGESYNQRLGLERARAICLLLVRQGIEGHRMRIRSKGESCPIDPRSTRKAYARNRRVEIRFIAPRGASAQAGTQ